MSDVAAIILAAGRSRRMGKFKPLLPFGHQTVIKSCIDNLQQAGVDRIVIVIGHRAADVKAHLAASSIKFALNPDPDSPMATSIGLGAGQFSPETAALIVTPVDHPAVPGWVIGAVIDEWKSGARLVQPAYHEQGGHPVLIDGRYREELLRLRPDEGLRGFFHRHRDDIRRLPVDSPYVARDMDTWEDYVRLHEEVFGYPPKP